MDATPVMDADFSLSSYDRTIEIDESDLSPTACLLLSDSSSFAHELGHRLVEPAHVAFLLFSGLSLPGKEAYADLGGRIMHRAGVAQSDAASFLRDELDICERSTAADVYDKVSFSHGFVDFMRDAKQEAQLFRDKIIGVDHLAVAAAIHMAEYGSEVGFNYEPFRVAALKVRGIHAEEAKDSASADYLPVGNNGLQATTTAAAFASDDEGSVDGHYQLPRNTSLAHYGGPAYNYSAVTEPVSPQQQYPTPDRPQPHDEQYPYDLSAGEGSDHGDDMGYTDAELAQLLQQAEVDASRAELEDLRSYHQQQQQQQQEEPEATPNSAICSEEEDEHGLDTSYSSLYLRNLQPSAGLTTQSSSSSSSGARDQKLISPASSAPDSPEAPYDGLTLEQMEQQFALLSAVKTGGKQPQSSTPPRPVPTSTPPKPGGGGGGGGDAVPDVPSARPESDTPSANEMPQQEVALWSVGIEVERDLDGMWFPAIIERAYLRSRLPHYDILYLDDGNRESDVEPWELRVTGSGGDDDETTTTRTTRTTTLPVAEEEEQQQPMSEDSDDTQLMLERYRRHQAPDFNDDL